MKRLPAELLLGQLSHNSSDDAVRDVLRQAFVNVDREYIESTMEAIKARIVLREDLRQSSEDRDRKLRELDLQVKRESKHATLATCFANLTQLWCNPINSEVRTRVVILISLATLP